MSSLIQEFERPVLISLVEKRHEYDDVYTFIFEPEKPIHFLSGQSAHVIVPDLPEPDNRRSFSFANAPHEKQLWFVTEVHSHGAYKRAWDKLKPGDSLRVTKVKSVTVLPEDPSTPVVMIAGGLGIAPFRSMLLDIKERELETPTTLMHVSGGDFLYEEDLKSLDATQYRIGRAEIDTTLDKIVKENPNAMYYVAGTPLFLGSLTDLLKEHGIDSNHILTSLFKRYMGFLE